MERENDKASMLMEKLNEEGKEMAVEYISYLVMSGKYPADNKRNDTCIHGSP